MRRRGYDSCLPTRRSLPLLHCPCASACLCPCMTPHACRRITPHALQSLPMHHRPTRGPDAWQCGSVAVSPRHAYSVCSSPLTPLCSSPFMPLILTRGMHLCLVFIVSCLYPFWYVLFFCVYVWRALPACMVCLVCMYGVPCVYGFLCVSSCLIDAASRFLFVWSVIAAAERV